MSIHNRTGRDLADREQLLEDVLEYRDQLLEQNAQLLAALKAVTSMSARPGQGGRMIYEDWTGAMAAARAVITLAEGGRK